MVANAINCRGKSGSELRSHNVNRTFLIGQSCIKIILRPPMPNDGAKIARYHRLDAKNASIFWWRGFAHLLLSVCSLDRSKHQPWANNLESNSTEETLTAHRLPDH
jgi:hypothetical protein